ncbi:uncharacterized protein KQ657_001768 [Scheffersomyces spartinae]|uniref:Peptidase M20 dimerisation domain-containing protein n=1 Tax=Scheffersomyces spartinae TaxID=45513 RepID=A0A9P7V6N6_9ASCO|nr:uncharacterized protein KQ657_001768 [Scheffersomyces spartinae]KAG7192369.1 hypothetical protein KQ657_001768 [Scheffersomyces spartinae]
MPANKPFFNASNPYTHADSIIGTLPQHSHHQFPLSGSSSVDSSHSGGYNINSAYPPSSSNYVASANSASQLDTYAPQLVHTWSPNHSILCVAASPSRKLLFCGTQDSYILIYDLESYSLARSISNGHNASVLTLILSEDENYLFTAGSDSLVKVWDVGLLVENSSKKESTTTTNNDKMFCNEEDEVCPIYIIYTFIDVGDIFSLSWSQEFKTLFIGTQNASILYCDLLFQLDRKNHNPDSIHNLPHVRFDKFFDSKGPGGSVNKLQTQQQLLRSQVTGYHHKAELIEINQNHIIRFAHNGFIYCMVLVKREDILKMFNTSIDSSYDIILISAGGDSIIKIWGVKKTNDCYKWTSLESLDNDDEYEVLSMSIEGTCLYAGLSNMILNVWDLTTFQLVRSISCGEEAEGQEDEDDDKDDDKGKVGGSSSDQLSDILSFAVYRDCVFKASHCGVTKYKLNQYPESSSSKREFKTKLDKKGTSYNILFVEIFSSSITNKAYLLAGGNRLLNLWDISQLNDDGHNSYSNIRNTLESTSSSSVSNDRLLQELSTFISFRTVSKFPSLYLEESRRCAQFLTSLFIKLGASQTKLLPVPNGNPIVYSLFRANSPNIAKKQPRILWYGHYDVVDADDDTWNSSPYHMTAKDGNLYARGVSDNKGPILAALFSVAKLYKEEQLGCDVVFIIEGEEECGSIGFQKIISEHRGLIESGGSIDWIMLLNSYWLDDTTPCLNYGHRGVINALITIKSEKPDRHSGVDGGVSREPTMDLVHLLSSLSSKDGKIQLDNFYDNVRPITSDETELLLEIVDHHETLDPSNLIAKWSSPSLTIHAMNVSGPHNNTTVIPQTATASISIRIVPNQDLNHIKASLVKYLHTSFDQLKSENLLSVNIFHEAEPWLGNPKNDLYQVLYQNLTKHWNMTPLFIREGGSIPSIRFLEKCLNAPAAQIPCGQASDNAHLLNEKLRIINLYKLRQVLTSTLTDLAKKNKHN